MLDLLEPFGLLPVAAPMVVFASWRIAALVVRGTTLVEHLAATAVTGIGLVHVLVATLATLGVLTPSLFFCSLVLVTGAALNLPRWRAERKTPGWLVVAGLLMSVPVALAVSAAWLLPVWQWDSIGYHLPFVNLVIQGQGFAAVPTDFRYVSTYPHDIELGMIGLRLLLPDDRLVDLAQVPYGLAGAVVTSAIASRMCGNRQGVAVLAGALWLFVPIVFLQLPTNYVDVGSAAAFLGAVYFLMLSPLSWRTGVVGAVALGIFLGSKPSTPLATCVVLASFAWRALPRQRLVFALALGVTFIFGAQVFLENAVRHGNPVWPVAVTFAGISLPGTHAVSELLAAGAALPSATGPLPLRVAHSLLAVFTPPAFDMKLGGLGLPVLLALPFALVNLVRRRDTVSLLALGASLVTPDPSIGRYVLAFAALTLALAFTELESWETPRRVLFAASVIGVTQLSLSFPGLTGDGPPLSQFWQMSAAERRVAVGPHGQPRDYEALWNRVRSDEAVAFDEDFEFPYLLFAPGLDYAVHGVPRLDPDRLTSWARAHRVRFVGVGERYFEAVARGPWRRVFDCRAARCAVFELDETLLSARGSDGPK
jgi:hypothetical protein